MRLPNCPRSDHLSEHHSPHLENPVNSTLCHEIPAKNRSLKVLSRLARFLEDRTCFIVFRNLTLQSGLTFRKDDAAARIQPLLRLSRAFAVQCTRRSLICSTA